MPYRHDLKFKTSSSFQMMDQFIIKICIIVSFGDHVIQAQEIDKKTESEESPIINVKA